MMNMEQNDDSFQNLLDGSNDAYEECMDDFEDLDGTEINNGEHSYQNDIQHLEKKSTFDKNNKNKTTKRNKRSFLFGKRIKKTEKGIHHGDDIIELDPVGDILANDDEFVIVGDNSGRFRNLKNGFKISFGIISFIALTVIMYLLMSFKIIPENIKGANYSIREFSVISRNYQPNLDELNIGDKIVCVEDEFNWLPFAVNYRKLEYQSRNGAIIFAKDEKGKSHKIQSIDINYIIKR